MPDRRYKIGLLVANIADTFSNQLARGAMQAAEDANADLFIFPGKYMGLEYLYEQFDAKYEYQYNVLFDIAAKAGLDYLIVAIGTIAYALSDDKKLDIMDKLGNVPKLSLAAKLPGYDYLIYDNRSGVVQAVEYLINEGKKNIGILAGDLNNTDCMERFDAFLKTMGEHGLTARHELVKECDISEKCAEAVKEFLDERADELDAVVCVNDAVAKELYRELHARGIRIGTDIAVTGFDDLDYASEMEPPLASIRADAVEMGRRSVEKAVNYLNGTPDDSHYLPTQFIPRQSSSAKGELYHAPETIFTGSVENIRRNVRAYFTERMMSSEEVKARMIESIDRLTEFLYLEFIENKATEDTLLKGISIANSIFGLQLMAVESLVRIYRFADGAYNWVLNSCPKENLIYLRKLYEYFYKQISNELVRDYRRLQDRNTDRTHINNIFIRDTLMFDRKSINSYSSTLKRMCDVGGVTSYLYLLKEPVNHKIGSEFNADTDWYFKAFNYGSEVYDILPADQRLTAQEIFWNDKLPDRRFTVIATILYSNKTQYGMMLIEPYTPDFFDELELVTYQMSSSIRTIGLLQTQETILADLHNRNMALDQMSKIDELTGIFNRRGFYLAADQMISYHSADDEMIVCFADMDNLKLVNDKYGHIEGDFSLRFLADLMCTIFGDDAVVGRMGGDEYAAIAPISSCGSIKEIRAKKEMLLAEFDERSEKPYKLGLSMGLISCTCENSYDLRAYLDRADDLLYAEKSKRKKEI